MSLAVDVIKKFMASLDATEKSGTEALDEAVAACSGYASFRELTDSFHAAASAASDGDEFLTKSCGIVLYNDDTGAITGSDAGGIASRSADDPLPEATASLETTEDGSRKLTSRGLTLAIPAASELSQDQEIIAEGLIKWWFAGALALVEDSFGLSFDEDDVTVREMTLEFDDDAASSNYAYVAYGYSTVSGEALSLSLHVNMAYFKGLSEEDSLGISDTTSYPLSRTLAHEFTHAVMAANVIFMGSLPLFVVEGTAELAGGIDDIRKDTIVSLASSPGYLATVTSPYITVSGSSTYAAGYMLFRYLAKNAGVTGVNGTYTIPSTSDGTYWLAEGFDASVTKLDASAVTGAVKLGGWGSVSSTLIGGRGESSLWGGGAADDVMIAGDGADDFYFGTGDGHDTIRGFSDGTDTLHIWAGSIDGFGTSGDDVILSAGTDAVVISGMAGRRIDVTDSSGRTVTGFVGRSDAGSILTGTDAVCMILGGPLDDTIYAGGAGGTVVGGGGGDLITGGGGSDVFIWFRGNGSDTISGFTSGEDTLIFADGTITDYAADGSDLLLYNGGTCQKLTGMAGRRTDIALADGDAAVYWFGRDDKSNRYTYAKDQRFYGSEKQSDTLMVNAKAEVSLKDTALYRNIDTVNANGATGSVTLIGGAAPAKLIGGAKKDVLTAGKKGDTLRGGAGADTLTGGTGVDVFEFAESDGKDTVKSFRSGKDVIRYTSGSLTKYKASGSDVLLYNGDGYQRLSGMAKKRIDLVNKKGKTTALRIGYSSEANSMKGYDVPSIIAGGSKADKLTAGAGGATLVGGRGSDTLVGGDGKDVFVYASGEGRDVIKKYTSGKDRILLTSGEIEKSRLSGSDVILTIGKGSIRVVGAKGKKITVTDSDGNTTRKVYGTSSAKVATEALLSDTAADIADTAADIAGYGDIFAPVVRDDTRIAIGQTLDDGSVYSATYPVVTSTTLAGASHLSSAR